MDTIIELSKRVESLGYKIGEKVDIIKRDYKCPMKLIYRAYSNRTKDLWFKSDEIRL